ncbi:MAG: hypothetical protein ABSE73_05325 [Planctomycetota bacterium]
METFYPASRNLAKCGTAGVHVSKCTAGVPPARGRPAGREDEGGRDARGTLWATHLPTHLLTCTRTAVAWPRAP